MAIEINGTTGISGVDGSAATPALQGTDTNTGISFGTDEVSINTGGTERVKVDSSGQVGIGTSSPNAALTVDGSAGNAKIRLGQGGDHTIIGPDSSGHTVINAGTSGGNMQFQTAGTERMRISSDGMVSIGTTSSTAHFDVRATGSTRSSTIYAERTGLTAGGQGLYAYTTATTAAAPNTVYSVYGTYVAATGVPGGGVIGTAGNVFGISAYFDTANTWSFYGNGSIYISGTYQGSDARLKDVVEPVSGGILDKLASIQPVKYKWKENTDQRNANGDGVKIGLIAQEVEVHFPELVKEVTHKCAIDPEMLEDGQFDSSCSLNHELGTFKTLEYQHLTAVLVEALKEAKERIETLETKVAALKGGAS